MGWMRGGRGRLLRLLGIRGLVGLLVRICAV